MTGEYSNYSPRVYWVRFSFDLHGLWPEHALNSVISSELLDHSESNVRVLDYVNGQILGPSYEILSNLDYPQAQVFPQRSPTFCTAVYDHYVNFNWSPFYPDNELAKWSMSFKVRVTFKQPISRGELKKATEYRWDRTHYVDSGGHSGCYIQYGLDLLGERWPEFPYVDDGYWTYPANPTSDNPELYQSFPGTKAKFEFNPYNPNSEGNGTRTWMNSEH